jgi:ferritin-like metal-binding protein YciE
MENLESNLSIATQNGIQSNEKSTNASMQSSQLMKFFEEELKDIYWAEIAVAKTIPKMIKRATSQDLIDALTSHLAETECQVIRLEQVFESINKKAVAVKCEAMEGLIKEAEEKMESCEAGAMCDAGIISVAQKAEHYEIASYITLCKFAKALELTKAVKLLETTLKEDRAADNKLFDLATEAKNADQVVA